MFEQTKEFVRNDQPRNVKIKSKFLQFFFSSSKVKTEHPPEWILLPSVMPLLSSTIFQTTSKPSSVMSSTHFAETTRFPTRKPVTQSSTKAPITKKPISKPSTIETTSSPTKPSTKKPQTTTTSTTAATTTTTSTTTVEPTERLPITTTQKVSAETTVLMDTSTSIDEEMPLSTESVTLFDEFDDDTTVYSEISETENDISHATSAIPVYTTSAGITSMSKANSTVAMSSTESSHFTTSSSSTEYAGEYCVHCLLRKCVKENRTAIFSFFSRM